MQLLSGSYCIWFIIAVHFYLTSVSVISFAYVSDIILSLVKVAEWPPFGIDLLYIPFRILVIVHFGFDHKGKMAKL